jgi:hypothetical protein
MMIFDVNAERCVFTRDSQRFVIGQNKGHKYGGEPFRFINTVDGVHLSYLGQELSYPKWEFNSTAFYGFNDPALRDISFEGIISETGQTLRYVWDAGYDSNNLVWPELISLSIIR